MLTDTVRLIGQLRNQGRMVLVHCVAAQSRTPTVAALYGARKLGISGKAALREVAPVLPHAYPNSASAAIRPLSVIRRGRPGTSA